MNMQSIFDWVVHRSLYSKYQKLHFPADICYSKGAKKRVDEKRETKGVHFTTEYLIITPLSFVFVKLFCTVSFTCFSLYIYFKLFLFINYINYLMMQTRMVLQQCLAWEVVNECIDLHIHSLSLHIYFIQRTMKSKYLMFRSLFGV